MNSSLDPFHDLRLEKLCEYARKWVEGPYDPRKRGPAWRVPIKTVSLHKPIPSQGPAGYDVVFELEENEHTLTYEQAKDDEWEYKSPIPMPNGFDALSKDEQKIVRQDLLERGMTKVKTLSGEHAEIDKLATACGRLATFIDDSPGSLRSFLIDKDFVRLVYKPQVVPANGEKVLRDEWRFHVLFPGEAFPDSIDEKGPFRQLYPGDQEGVKKAEPKRETRSIDPDLYKDVSPQQNIDLAETNRLVAIGQAFAGGPKHGRLDNLNKAIKKAWQASLKETGTKPTARNVYDWLEEKGNIIEKEEGDNGDPIAIHWKRSKGKEEKTPYHTFENRLSRLKKKGILSLPQSSE